MKSTFIALLALCLCVVGCATFKDIGKQVVALGGEFSCMWNVTAKEQRQYKNRSLFTFAGIPHRRILVFNAKGTVMGGKLVRK